MDEIRFVAGPIVARYLDKLEEERQAVLKAQEEKAAKVKAEAEAKKKAEEEAKKAAEQKKDNEVPTTNGDDVDMKDAEAGTVEVEEPK